MVFGRQQVTVLFRLLQVANNLCFLDSLPLFLEGVLDSRLNQVFLRKAGFFFRDGADCITDRAVYQTLVEDLVFQGGQCGADIFAQDIECLVIYEFFRGAVSCITRLIALGRISLLSSCLSSFSPLSVKISIRLSLCWLRS